MKRACETCHFIPFDLENGPWHAEGCEIAALRAEVAALRARLQQYTDGQMCCPRAEEAERELAALRERAETAEVLWQSASDALAAHGVPMGQAFETQLQRELAEARALLAELAQTAEEMGALFPSHTSAAVICRGMSRKARAVLRGDEARRCFVCGGWDGHRNVRDHEGDEYLCPRYFDPPKRDEAPGGD